jgi:hypothetical protein
MKLLCLCVDKKEGCMNVSFILLIILTAVRLWIAIQLFLTARKSHLDNLYWLAGMFILAIYTLFAPTGNSPISNIVLFYTGYMAGHFCLAMFIHTTFHRKRSSPLNIVLIVLGLAFLVQIYAFIVNNPGLAGVMSLSGLVTWGWHFVVARSAYTKIVNDSNVERWVKARYRLMMVYVVMMMLPTIQLGIFTSNPSLSFVPIILIIGLLAIIGSVILQFLVWMMPEPFRLWLNREPQSHTRQIEQASLSIMDVFAAAMTADTGLTSMVCLYALRSAISKRIHSDDSNSIRQHINAMTYHEWDTVLQQADLTRVLINGGADRHTASLAVENARHALVEKQSLLTFGAR